MKHTLKITNSISREKEVFEPFNPPFVGMYVCGPTVYNDVHLGNVRTFLNFDVINRYLRFLGYKVRYVRNITDVGHLTDTGEDKISTQAKLEKLEPMEIVQKYQNDFHKIMDTFNILAPDIEPTATGHLMEQIEAIEKIIENGYAYESNGSVYFDVNKYNAQYDYGILSGRKIEELITNTRDLEGGSDKRNPLDFALWKKANPEHIMQWKTKWGYGFPGWHLECSVMSTKYLGSKFDIHGGGMDLKFPHHECEIAQNKSITGENSVKYWIHSNMLTVNGVKMSKSLGNFILPHQMISGEHELLSRGYSPMTIRFLMLQTHYASTIDFSDEALNAALKGYNKLVNSIKILKNMTFPQNENRNVNEKTVDEIEKLCHNCYQAMNDDFNTALTIANIFQLIKKVNSLHTGQLKYEELTQEVFDKMKKTVLEFTEEVLGLKADNQIDSKTFLDYLLSEYSKAKEAKNYSKVDEIRAVLKSQNIIVKDMKNNIDWAFEE